MRRLAAVALALAVLTGIVGVGCARAGDAPSGERGSEATDGDRGGSARPGAGGTQGGGGGSGGSGDGGGSGGDRDGAEVPGSGEETEADPIAPPQQRVVDRAWREVFFDDFDTLDTSVWRVYDGRPGCCPRAQWDPSMVRVADGSLYLDNRRVDGEWLSGGVGSWGSPTEQRYGRWDVRVRTDPDALGVTVAALLWPGEGGWPPEVDFYEIFETRADRDEMMITNHYGELEADGSHPATRRPVPGDFSRWHEVSVRWTPDVLQVVLDGRAVETIRNPEQIPSVPMWLAMQTAVVPVDGRFPTFGGTRSMQVDWVRVYEPA